MANQDRSAVVDEVVLKSFCKRLLQKVGVPEQDADIVTENLIEADLRGVGSHGVVRLPIYIRRLLDGGTNKAARVHTTRETATTLVIDGDNGLGHFVGVQWRR